MGTAPQTLLPGTEDTHSSYSEEILITWSLLATKYPVLVIIINIMGQQESTYRKFDDKSRRKVKLVTKEENNNKENTEEKNEKKRKEKNFSLLSFNWRSGMSNVNSGEDLDSWPGWYHGWCNRGQVEKLLSGGPNGLYLVKNSTEFAGDLTLCLLFEGAVLYYRIRSQQGGRFTVDNDQTFSSVSGNISNLVSQCRICQFLLRLRIW